MENDKIEKLKCDILGDFQTLCASRNGMKVVFEKYPWKKEACNVSRYGLVHTNDKCTTRYPVKAPSFMANES